MKKYLLMAVLAIAAFSSCNKEQDEKTRTSSFTLASEAQVAASMEGEIVTVEFASTTRWTAKLDVADAVATVTPASGEAGDACKVKVSVMPNTTDEDKTITLTIDAEDLNMDGLVNETDYAGYKPLVVTITQSGKPHMTISDELFEVPVEGGSFTVTVNANVEFSVTDYSDGSFPWQHATASADGKTYTVTIDANQSYDARESYVKFKTSALQDEEGNDLTIRVYFNQAALPCTKYLISMYDASFDTWGTTVLSEALYNGKHYVSNGQDLYEINPADGSYAKIDWPWGAGMTQKVITNDDAGNLIVCNHTAYINESYLDGYFILNVVTPAGVEKNLITQAAWELGGPFGAKIKVRGDVTSDAVIVAPVEGIDGITMSMTIGYWEIYEGTELPYEKLTASGFVGTWSCGAWNTYPNNFPTILPMGNKSIEGFIMSGMYAENAVYFVDAESGACVKILTPELMVGEDDLNGNLGCQSISTAVIGGKTYFAMLASPFFPDYGPGWSGAPYLSIMEVPATLPSAPLNMWADANLVKICDSFFPWDADPAIDWGISVAADVVLFDADGKIGVALVDLNGRCIDSYEFDPATIAK